MQRDRTVGYLETKRCSDGAVDEVDFAAMRAHKFGGDHQAKTGTTGPGSALERLEQMRPRLVGESRAGIGDGY